MRERLNRSIYKKVDDPLALKEKSKFTEEMTSSRKEGIKEWYKRGGKLFKEWVKEYYHRWSGEKLKWDDPHLNELFDFFGNPWIQSIVISKSAQCGFTELCISFSAFCLAYTRVSVCFGVEQSQKLRDIIAPRVQPSFDNCNPIVKIKDKKKRVTGRLDTDSKDRIITVGGVPITFFWMSRSSANDGRKATSSVSSFEGWVAIADEIELMPVGALDIIRQRQNSCTMPSKPFRAGSTPGSIGGIVDTEVKKSGYSFEWSVKCPHCYKDQFLNGFGNLLKSVHVEENNGEKREKYLDELGRPLDWFHKAKEHKPKSAKINSSYIGCQYCYKEITQSSLSKGQFICKRTGNSMKDISDYYLNNQEVLNSTCSIQIPRLALNNFSPSGMIDQLLNSRDPADTIQQGFGIAVSIGSGKIELDIILDSQKEPPEELGEPELTIIGFDQGRVNNYAVVQNWWFPNKYRDSQKTWQEAIKQNVSYELIPWGFPPSFKYLDQLCEKYQANWICLDSDPESNLALNYARERLPNNENKNQVILCDQVRLTGKKFARRNQGSNSKKKRKSGEQPILKKIPFYSIDRTFGLDSVRDRFYRGNCYLPPLDYDQNDDDNPILHYRTSERGSDNLWREPQAAPDHFFHADNFGEMAALISFYEKRSNKLSFGTLD